MIHKFNDRGRIGTILVATSLSVWSAAALTGCDDGGDPRFKAETYDEYTEPLTNAVIGTPGGTMIINAAGTASDGGVVIPPTPDAGPVRDAGGSVDGRPSGVGGATGAAGKAGGVDGGGFAGTMGALLSAIETGVEPINCARRNLASLRLSHAAIESANTGKPVNLA